MRLKGRERKILEWLDKNGPHFRNEIKEGLNVPEEGKERRSFYRAINRLIEYGVLMQQKDGRIAKVGYQ